MSDSHRRAPAKVSVEEKAGTEVLRRRRTWGDRGR